MWFFLCCFGRWAFQPNVQMFSLVYSASVWHEADLPSLKGCSLEAHCFLCLLISDTSSQAAHLVGGQKQYCLRACLKDFASACVCVCIHTCARLRCRWLILKDNVHYSDGLAFSVTAVALAPVSKALYCLEWTCVSEFVAVCLCMHGCLPERVGQNDNTPH